MTSEEYRLLIPQYLAGQLTSTDADLFERQLQTDSNLRVEVAELRSLWEGLAFLRQAQPSPALRARFYGRLSNLQRQDTRNAARSFKWSPFGGLTVPSFIQIAAVSALLFALGVYVGTINSAEHQHAEQMKQMTAQVQSLREVVALSLLGRDSATSRLEGVYWSNRVDRPNQELLSALLATLNHDANVNVRLSTLETLGRFMQDAVISKALIDSLDRQDSPLVQIALIDSLVHTRNRAVEPELKRLTTDMNANPAVRQRAQWGLEKLSFE